MMKTLLIMDVQDQITKIPQILVIQTNTLIIVMIQMIFITNLYLKELRLFHRFRKQKKKEISKKKKQNQISNTQVNKNLNENESLLRNECIVIPTSSFGDVSETRKLILHNSLESSLKDYFKIVPQERFQEAQEKAFEELDYEECTEDQCIIMIQEMLQIENVFHLQVINDEGYTQLSLSWRNLDEKKKENELCEECNTKQLNEKIKSMIERFLSQI